jgi:hypothetical protein
MPIDGKFLKTAVMSYFRFERTYVVATEVNCKEFGIADVLVDTGDEIVEIEIKRYKNDLTVNELKKQKHSLIKDENTELTYPNRYFICVPDNLAREAERFVRSLNADYGLIVVNTKNKLNSRSAKVVKHAKKLHDTYSVALSKAIVLRLCSELANLYEVQVNEEFKDELDQDINVNRNFLADEDRDTEEAVETLPMRNVTPRRSNVKRTGARRNGDDVSRRGVDYSRPKNVTVSYE